VSLFADGLMAGLNKIKDDLNSIENASSDNPLFDVLEKGAELAVGLLWGYFLLGGSQPANLAICFKDMYSIIGDIFEGVITIIEDVNSGDVLEIW